jgi:hypothetical protein
VGHGHGYGAGTRPPLIYDTNDQQTIAFTPDGMEYLRAMLVEYKRNRSSPRP